MDTPPKLTSFIPKNSPFAGGLAGLTTVAAGSPVRRSPSRVDLSGAYNLVGVISFAALALTLVFTAGAFIYRLMILQQIYGPCQADGRCGLTESLKRDRQNLGVENLLRAKRLSVKTASGQALIDKHQAASPLFRQVLNTLTIAGVSYNKFDFGDHGVTIAGVAKSYEDVAFQAKVFAGADAKGKIKSFNFYDLDLDKDGNVVFKLDLTVEPSVSNFSRLILPQL